MAMTVTRLTTAGAARSVDGKTWSSNSWVQHYSDVGVTVPRILKPKSDFASLNSGHAGTRNPWGEEGVELGSRTTHFSAYVLSNSGTNQWSAKTAVL
jgi:hypothetical protein